MSVAEETLVILKNIQKDEIEQAKRYIRLLGETVQSIKERKELILRIDDKTSIEGFEFNLPDFGTKEKYKKCIKYLLDLHKSIDFTPFSPTINSPRRFLESIGEVL